MSEDKLNCEEVIEQLFTYLDGELDHVHSAAIDRHLERCRDCFSRAEFEKRLRERIRASAKASAPDSLHRRVKGLLDQY
ncbi:putative transmembrane anti-sigma factor [Thioalkalivibrio sulfidiphilus HL-EbGr7]|uniref:Putative transmembrane anti-sigma factor n=1 Tax=Thioalkalivibrio sulfidiphilus (strain HL-EbGR7) TaxID=396588 RepID=B8GS91_THISH|nr:zf-HC2 domain-containing protein [Thioalkalivibrio sulfidiphilus]ACL72795.1 putative transmembrane anti-sigma factor [Thioalkalivibrio sulfidiphilus HL-EbGr7]